MSEIKQITAQDGHVLNAYMAFPTDESIGAVVLVQEIFGVNAHIRAVADGFAQNGFLVVVPALFDRYESDVELSYEGADKQRAAELYQKLDPETALLDVAAAFFEAKAAGKGVGVVGYCYGGLMSWLAATRGEDLKMRPDCCVGYYAGGIGSVAQEQPSCPVMLHFGAEDAHVGQDQIEAVRSAHPDVEIFVYDGAEHGFNNDARSSFDSVAAGLARERTLSFLQTHIA